MNIIKHDHIYEITKNHFINDILWTLDPSLRILKKAITTFHKKCKIEDGKIISTDGRQLHIFDATNFFKGEPLGICEGIYRIAKTNEGSLFFIKCDFEGFPNCKKIVDDFTNYSDIDVSICIRDTADKKLKEIDTMRLYESINCNKKLTEYMVDYEYLKSIPSGTWHFQIKDNQKIIRGYCNHLSIYVATMSKDVLKAK